MNPPLPFGHTFQTSNNCEPVNGAEKIRLAEAILENAFQKITDLKLILTFESGGNRRVTIERFRFNHARSK